MTDQQASWLVVVAIVVIVLGPLLFPWWIRVASWWNTQRILALRHARGQIAPNMGRDRAHRGPAGRRSR